MSIYDAIANPMVPNIAQATMQGRGLRMQEQQAAQQAQLFPLQLQAARQAVDKGDLEIAALRNPPTDFSEQFEQITAQNDIVYNALSGVTDEDSYQNILPVLRRVDREAPAQYDPEYVRESLGNASRWRENQTAMGKAYADAAVAAAQGDEARARAILEAAMPQTQQDQPSYQRFSAVVNGEDQPSTLSYDDATGQTFRIVNGERQNLSADQFTPVTVTGSREQVMPPNRTDAIRAELDWMEFGISEIDGMIEKINADPAIVGLTGGARRFVRTWSGMADDLAQMFGTAGAQDAQDTIAGARSAALRELNRGNMDEEMFFNLFGNPDLDEVPLFENALTYMLARTWQPEDRLLAQTVNSARSSVNITGVRSSETAVNNLNYVRRQMQSRQRSLQRRLQGDDSPTQNDIPTVSDISSYNNLAPGTQYRDPNGVLRVKGGG